MSEVTFNGLGVAPKVCGKIFKVSFSKTEYYRRQVEKMGLKIVERGLLKSSKTMIRL